MKKAVNTERAIPQTTNKSIGNDFENELAQSLFNEGFWVHVIAQRPEGQPADIIAAKDGKTFLIDCKVCSDDRFSLDRVEDNQSASMTYWKITGNGVGWFALKTSEGVYFIPHNSLEGLFIVNTFLGKRSLNLTDIKRVGFELEEWLYLCK